MANKTKIEWCDHTDNLWHGCVEVHAGCDNCYARVTNHRWGKNNWGTDVPRLLIKSVWTDLQNQQRNAKDAGEYRTVFVGSMMDIFEKPMPLIDHELDPVAMNTGELRDQLFNDISNNRYPNLIFLLLTKRPGNINKYIPLKWKTNPPDNVWFGTSPVDNKTASKLVYQLLQVNGKRFLSVEPMLDKIDWYEVSGSWGLGLDHPWRGVPILTGIHWLICGGESGAGKRPFDTDWARAQRDFCAMEYVDVPFFMKQIDKVQKIPEDLMIRQYPKFR